MEGDYPLFEKKPPQIAVHIRWLIKRDMLDILTIERDSFEQPWSEAEFRTILTRRNIVGMTAESKKFGHVVGYMIYELAKRELRLANFAVARASRRYGVGTQMLDKLKTKIHPDRRYRITLDVPETLLGTHKFLRTQEFRATEVVRRHYDDGGDAYRFEWVEPSVLASLRTSATDPMNTRRF